MAPRTGWDDQIFMPGELSFGFGWRAGFNDQSFNEALVVRRGLTGGDRGDRSVFQPRFNESSSGPLSNEEIKHGLRLLRLDV